MSNNKIFTCGILALIGLGSAQEQTWQQVGPIKVFEWNSSQTLPFGNSPLVTEVSNFTDLKLLKIADGSPIPHAFYRQFRTNDQNWYSQNATLTSCDAKSKCSDSSSIAYTWFSPKTQIPLDQERFFPVDNSKFANTLRILGNSADTLQNGLFKAPMGEQYLVKGILTGSSTTDSTRSSIWYGSALIFHGDTLRYLAQINNGDSAKVKATISNSLARFEYDSLKIQLIQLNYQNTPSLQRNIEIPTTAPKSVKVIRGPFEIEGRTIRITQKSDTKQLLNVFNAEGEVLQFWKFVNLNGIKEVQLDQGHYPAGVYFLKLYNSSGSFQTQAIFKD